MTAVRLTMKQRADLSYLKELDREAPERVSDAVAFSVGDRTRQALRSKGLVEFDHEQCRYFLTAAGREQSTD